MQWKCLQVDHNFGTKHQCPNHRQSVAEVSRCRRHKRKWHRLWAVVQHRLLLWIRGHHSAYIWRHHGSWSTCWSVVSASSAGGGGGAAAAAGSAMTSSFAVSWPLQQANFGRRSLSLQCIKQTCPVLIGDNTYVTIARNRYRALSFSHYLSP